MSTTKEAMSTHMSTTSSSASSYHLVSDIEPNNKACNETLFLELSAEGKTFIENNISSNYNIPEFPRLALGLLLGEHEDCPINKQPKMAILCTILAIAVSRGYIKLVKVIFKEYEDALNDFINNFINCSFIVHYPGHRLPFWKLPTLDHYPTTLLGMAAFNGQFEMMRFLILEKKANPNMPSALGMTPLDEIFFSYEAQTIGRYDWTSPVVDYLLSHGAAWHTMHAVQRKFYNKEKPHWNRLRQEGLLVLIENIYDIYDVAMDRLGLILPAFPKALHGLIIEYLYGYSYCSTNPFEPQGKEQSIKILSSILAQFPISLNSLIIDYLYMNDPTLDMPVVINSHALTKRLSESRWTCIRESLHMFFGIFISFAILAFSDYCYKTPFGYPEVGENKLKRTIGAIFALLTGLCILRPFPLEESRKDRMNQRLEERLQARNRMQVVETQQNIGLKGSQELKASNKIEAEISSKAKEEINGKTVQDAHHESDTQEGTPELGVPHKAQSDSACSSAEKVIPLAIVTQFNHIRRRNKGSNTSSSATAASSATVASTTASTASTATVVTAASAAGAQEPEHQSQEQTNEKDPDDKDKKKQNTFKSS